jgi:hypothetical protein
MPQFMVLSAHTPDGKTAEYVVNLDQVTRVLVTGPKGSVEAVQVFLSDGHHFTLREKAAADFFDVVTQPNYGARPPGRPSSPSPS